MRKRGDGVIVNVGSVNSFFEPDAGVIDYGAAKAALTNVAKSLSQEFGPEGIRITTIAPGPVATDLWLGKGGVADTLGQATGAGADAIRQQAMAGMADRPVHLRPRRWHRSSPCSPPRGPATSPAPTG